MFDYFGNNACCKTSSMESTGITCISVRIASDNPATSFIFSRGINTVVMLTRWFALFFHMLILLTLIAH